ncbi:V-type ATP synthase subunit I [Sphaerochaeta sp.]|uniref:V-type ATP synthase subunit I n=1 Tax=Sphaerochaeta sp. TaxID=1972642 RepID=UPI002FC90C10
MIVPMKKAYIIVQAHQGRSMLRSLRKAGLLHIMTQTVQNEPIQNLQRTFDATYQVRSAILDLQDKKQSMKQEVVSDEAMAEILERYVGLLDRKKHLDEELTQDRAQIELLRGWGDFDPEQIRSLQNQGISLSFYTVSKKDLQNLDPAISYIQLDPVQGQQAIATVNQKLPEGISATLFTIPEHGLHELQAREANGSQALAHTVEQLKKGGVYLDALAKQLQKLEMSMRFEQVDSHLQGDEQLVWINGYLPESEVKAFESLASQNSWAYLIEDVTEDDAPPTLVKYPKGVGIIKPVFDILGTVPGYRENDISTWFLLFFTLFFAMIIGDAGYGLIFLSVAVALHAKAKKANTLVMLVYVLSLATLVWGSLTGTWFGSKEILTTLPFLQKLVIPSISNYPELFGLKAVDAQNHVMKFCFIIGTVQLSLACILNVIHKLPEKNLSFLADIGWLIDILSLYFVVLQLVIGQSANIGVVFTLVGVGFVLVVVFGSQAPGVPFLKGLTSGLGGFFTTFLNTISAFSNIMSYIRLFAVGMASVAIAQSFNSMAGGMLSGFAMIGGILVLVIGHSLNLVMGLLSVVVHGVRLNLLEFSGQLGMEWTGIAYEPFAQTVEEN